MTFPDLHHTLEVSEVRWRSTSQRLEVLEVGVEVSALVPLPLPLLNLTCMNPDTFFYDSVLRFSVQKNQAFPPIITGAVLPGIVADFGS
jgi:hypothetical protein